MENGAARGVVDGEGVREECDGAEADLGVGRLGGAPEQRRVGPLRRAVDLSSRRTGRDFRESTRTHTRSRVSRVSDLATISMFLESRGARAFELSIAHSRASKVSSPTHSPKSKRDLRPVVLETRQLVDALLVLARVQSAAQYPARARRQPADSSQRASE